MWCEPPHVAAAGAHEGATRPTWQGDWARMWATSPRSPQIRELSLNARQGRVADRWPIDARTVRGRWIGGARTLRRRWMWARRSSAAGIASKTHDLASHPPRPSPPVPPRSPTFSPSHRPAFPGPSRPTRPGPPRVAARRSVGPPLPALSPNPNPDFRPPTPGMTPRMVQSWYRVLHVFERRLRRAEAQNGAQERADPRTIACSQSPCFTA